MKVILQFNGYSFTKTVVVKSAQVLEKSQNGAWNNEKQRQTLYILVWNCFKLKLILMYIVYFTIVYKEHRECKIQALHHLTLKGYFSLPINTKCSKVCGKPSSSWASVAAIQKKCLLNWWKTISPSNSYLRKYLHIPRN